MFMFQYVTVLLRTYHFYKQVHVDCIWFNLTESVEVTAPKAFTEDFTEAINLPMGIVFVSVARLSVLCDLFPVLELSVENGGKPVNGALVTEEESAAAWLGDIVALVGCGQAEIEGYHVFVG